MLEPHEVVEASVPCTCIGEHEQLAVSIGVDGFPKRNSLKGNHLCWYNQWAYIRSGLKPGEKILRKWARRYRRWSPIKWSDRYIQQTMQRYAKYCGLERHNEIRNTLGRKTCVTVGLGDMQLPVSIYGQVFFRSPDDVVFLAPEPFLETQNPAPEPQNPAPETKIQLRRPKIQLRRSKI